jgi:NAD(P)-dependent dehydrogenase (short-subunit alcohol dehydrogenase family)
LCFRPQFKEEQKIMRQKWTSNDISDQSGKVVIVTGANSGIGYETAKALVQKGAKVIMACRNLEKAATAANHIRQEVVSPKLEIMQLDLADLASVRQFATTFKANYDRLDILVNNAGIMVPPFTQTKDGFEVQFGANHLGHFALTGLLLDTILATPQARIVNVSSNTHRMGSGTIDFDNLNAEKGYKAAAAYAQSKLANLLFTLELTRRFAEMNADVTAVAAHPGWTATGLQKGVMHSISRVVGQSPPMGALPTLRAAADPDVQPNDYYGPGGFMEMRGYPKEVDTSDAAKDAALAKKLWQVSEELTAVTYPWPA